MNKKHLLLILFILSLTINLLLLSFYFLKISPEIKSLQDKLKITNISCTGQRVYSQSRNEIICLTKEEVRSQGLSKCSNNFSQSLSDKTLTALKSISDLEKIRELAIKTCMQNAGLDYP